MCDINGWVHYCMMGGPLIIGFRIWLIKLHRMDKYGASRSIKEHDGSRRKHVVYGPK